MAPEQLEGREADARSDIFAFGALLYEMLTGRKAFEGNTPASVIAADMTAEPQSLSELEPKTPRALEHLTHVCLAKNPDERWQSAGDICAQVGWIATNIEGRHVERTRVSSREIAAWGVAALLLIRLFQETAICCDQPSAGLRISRAPRMRR
jgi:serine/threonine-protein kinase